MARRTRKSNSGTNIKARSLWLFIVFSIFFLAIAARLVYVQVIGNEKYVKYADSLLRPGTEPAMRGGIYDRNGSPLAIDLESIDVFADMNMFKADNDSVAKVAKALGLNKSKLAAKLKSKRKIIYIARNMDPKFGDVIKSKSDPLYGIGFDTNARRVYPSGHLAAQVLGFTKRNGEGASGIELSMDSTLKGTDGKYLVERDSHDREIPDTKKILEQAVDGKSVYLTIDSTIQHYTERAMAAMAKKYTPEHAVAIVMDPHTGEVLALANYPTYDANNARKADSTLWRNRAVSDIYEPGSTQKVFTVAYALNEGYTVNHSFAYCRGKEKIKGGKIPCLLHHPYENGHGSATMPMIIKQSCNIGAAHVALKLGAHKFFKYEEAFGMTKKLQSGIQGETVGWVRNPDRLKPIELANNGFGQGLVVTPLHMATGYCVIANGGSLVQPQIIREIRDNKGTVYSKFEKKVLRRVISSNVAATVRKLMAACVEEGTGKTAAVAGRRVAGKTGSAQIAKTKGRGYENGAFVSSFMGCAPVDNPRLVIAVAVFKPKGSHWGATVAAPVFREIAESSLLYLKVPSENEKTPKIKSKPESKTVALLP